MKSLFMRSSLILLGLFITAAVRGQTQSPQAPVASSSGVVSTVVPRLIKHGGTLLDEQGQAMKSPVGVTFALYSQEFGGAALWMETQNVATDAKGNYTVLLGANSALGVSAELFNSGEARWLGVQVEREAERPRVLLVSVPYALKAGDAQTLGGKPLSAFQMALAGSSGTGSNNAVSNAPQPALTEQANEITCSSGSACSATFIPQFNTNGGSSTVANSIMKQSGTNVLVSGSLSATSTIHSANAISASKNITAGGTVSGAAGSFSGNISSGGNVSVNGNVGAGTATTLSSTGGVTATMTGTGNGIAAVTGSATAAGAAGFTFGVIGQSASDTGRGVFGLASGSNGVGVIGETSAGGIGVLGKALSGSTGYGVWGEASASAIDGVHGVAHSAGFSGVAGLNDGNNGFGVFGEAFGTALDGVHGVSNNASGSGVAGINFAGGDGIFGGQVPGGFAGFFSGNVNVTGNLSKGGGSFKIDHPLDPANKYLYHSFVESPDMMNIYNGNVTTDIDGNATVALPKWFEVLNRDFRYQLTVMGQFAQAMVSSEIASGQFSIKTDKPNVKVSWQVTGIRQDAWANAHRIPVEEMKPERERGFYLHPELFGAPVEQGIAARRHPFYTERPASKSTLLQDNSANH